MELKKSSILFGIKVKSLYNKISKEMGLVQNIIQLNPKYQEI